MALDILILLKIKGTRNEKRETEMLIYTMEGFVCMMQNLSVRTLEDGYLWASLLSRVHKNWNPSMSLDLDPVSLSQFKILLHHEFLLYAIEHAKIGNLISLISCKIPVGVENFTTTEH